MFSVNIEHQAVDSDPWLQFWLIIVMKYNLILKLH